MSWLYESFRLPSDANGEILCHRLLGRWSVQVGDAGQTSGYLNELWRKAVRHVPSGKSVKRVLVLGFGTGGAFPIFFKAFPSAHFVSVEIDPVMVDLAKRFKTLPRGRMPELHLGAAEDVLPKLQGRFDIIISDMFIGNRVAKETTSHAFHREIERLLAPNGHLFVNAYLEAEALAGFHEDFAEVSRWKHYANWVGHFRPHGAGVLGDRLPDGYVPFFACPEYIQRDFQNWRGFTATQAGQAWGVRRKIGPIVLERYSGDAEPIPDPSVTGPRIILWDPVTRRDAPKSWHRVHGNKHRSLTGYAIIPHEGEFHAGWSELAKRERKKWLAQDEWDIAEVDVETYCAAYRVSGTRRSLIDLFSDAVRRKAVGHGNRLHLYATRSRKDGRIIAGLAALDVPEIGTSVHVTGFFDRNFSKVPAGAGLVDRWFRDSQARGIRFCDFDGFYDKGELPSWKGFSQFKGQFGTRYIKYPNGWWRWG